MMLHQTVKWLYNHLTVYMKEIEYRAAMVLECLGEPIRFQIIRHLQDSPRGVTELARLTKRHKTTICQHLAVLRNLNIVRYRNSSRLTIYRIKNRDAHALLDLAVRCARGARDEARETPTVRAQASS